MKQLFYLKSFLYNQLPAIYFKKRYQQLQSKLSTAEQENCLKRVEYYCQLREPTVLPATAVTINDFNFNVITK